MLITGCIPTLPQMPEPPRHNRNRRRTLDITKNLCHLRTKVLTSGKRYDMLIPEIERQANHTKENLAMKLYQAIAHELTAMENCKRTGNTEWEFKHHDALVKIERDNLPRGSGFDAGCAIETGQPGKVVIATAYHAMDENGMYDGWDDYTVTVKPSLLFGFELRVTGPKRNREYVAEVMQSALDEEYTEERNN